MKTFTYTETFDGICKARWIQEEIQIVRTPYAVEKVTRDGDTLNMEIKININSSKERIQAIKYIVGVIAGLEHAYNIFLSGR